MLEIQNLKLALSIKEACAATSLGRTSIFGKIKKGELRAVRIGGRTLIPVQSLRDLLGLERDQ